MNAQLLALAVLPLVGASDKPHIVFFMVDDWGWNDLGVHHRESGAPANEIQTPHIDALIAKGVLLDRAYAYQWCTPTRSSFLSGRLPVHIAYNVGNVCNANEGIPRGMTSIAAKLKEGGYATHQLGKWDAGMSTPTHTPQGRGFDTSLGYFDHENDYFNYRPQTPFNTSGFGGPCPINASLRDLWDTDKPAPGLADGTYEEEILFRRATEIIQAHDTSTPLFLYYAFHIVHAPLEVTDEWLEKYAFIRDSSTRQAYHAMVGYMDAVVGNVTSMLKARGMWDNLLIVSSSDNGGPIYPGGGANNFPLKGGKISDWEGGIRVNSWVSGGFLPPSAVGTKVEGFVHIADWWHTFSHLAGVVPSDPSADKAGLPPPDSLNVWPLVSGANSTSPHTHLHISPNTFIRGQFKVIVGDSGTGFGGPTDQNGWTGPVYPNGTSGTDGRGGISTAAADCRAGCLFNILEDPTEQHDLSATMPTVLSALIAELQMANRTLYDPPVVPNDPKCCVVAETKYGGFIGPFLP